MVSSKLVILFKSLSQKEVNAFLKFCETDLFYVRDKVKELVTILQTIHPDFTEKNTSAVLISRQLFGNKKTDLQKVRLVFSHTTLLLEKFLSWQAFQKNPFLQNRLLLTELVEKKQDKYLVQHLKKLEHDQSQKKIHNADYYDQQFQLTEWSNQYASTYDDHNINNLQQTTDSLDIMYLSKKLKYSCEMLNQQNVMQVKYELHFINELSQAIQQSGFIELPAISVYFSILKMFLNTNETDNYYAFKKNLLSHEQLFPFNEQRSLFTYLQNYCIRMANTGNESFLKEMFENYEHMLAHKIIIEGDKISQFDFKNIITLALRLKKHDWSEVFLKKYSHMIDEEIRENAINYNQSRIYYSKAEYKNALKILQQVEFNDVYYHLDSQILLLKIYYDTEAEEPFYSLINSFKIFLKRSKKISTYQYTVNYNFCRHISRLYSIKTGGKGSLDGFRNTLRQNRQVVDVSWLEERANELG